MTLALYKSKKPVDIDHQLRYLISTGANLKEIAQTLGVCRQTASVWLKESGWEPVQIWRRRAA